MSRRLPALKPRAVLRMLKRAGAPAARVTLPWHNRDLKRGTLVSIIEQSGHSIEEFLRLL